MTTKILEDFQICITVPLNHKRVSFSSFNFDGFKDPINVPGG